MFDDEYRQFVIREHTRTIDLAAKRAQLKVVRPEDAPVVDRPVALRLCSVHDDAALERLGQLEGRRVSTGRFVVAEVNGAIVAAQPLDGGAPLADPFEKTEHLLPLLRLQADQLVAIALGQAQPRLRSLRRVYGIVRG